MSQLKNIVRFTAVPAGDTQVLPHGLNIRGRAITPDVYFPASTGAFEVTVDGTNVTVTNVGADASDVDVLVEHWHTLERVFGPEGVFELTPQPLGLGGVLAGQWVTFPQLRTEDAGAANRPDPIVGASTFGYSFDLGDRLFFEVPIHPLCDRTQDVTIGVSFAPTGSEVGTVVSWRANVLPAKVGTDLSLAGNNYDAIDVANPDAAGIYARAGITVPAAELSDPDVDEFHVRVRRIASSSDPVANPAIHHIAVIQQLAR